MILLIAALLLAGCSTQSQQQGEIASPTVLEPSPERPSSTLTATPSPMSPAARASSPTPRGAVSPVSLRTPTSDLNCTYTIYYWTNNPNRWMADNIIIGRATYTKENALKILTAKTDDQAARTLQQFFGAVLNVLKGASSNQVEELLNETTAWLIAHPIGSQITDEERQQGAGLAEALASFNEGRTGPGLCADEPSTPTPTPTPTSTATLTPTFSDTQQPTTRRPTSTPRPRPQTTEEPVTATPEPTESPATTAPATSPPATSIPTTQPPTATRPPNTPTSEPERPTPSVAPSPAPTAIVLPTDPSSPVAPSTPPASVTQPPPAAPTTQAPPTSLVDPVLTIIPPVLP